ncbi:universal stress protein [Pelagibius sp.]|uniref:universal stress protein n=1 Tax=Pelagibius sp. TaxID=1931238 RepID=UPI003BB0EC2F
MSKKILVPIDLEHQSSWLKALPNGVNQARILDGEVWLMTVVPHIPSGIDWRYAIRGEEHGSIDYDVKDFVKQAEERMRELAKEHIPEDYFGGIIAAHGTIYEKIVEAAEEIGAELIVMAAHRPSLKDYLLGPNTARVARHAACSVQIVRD